MQRRLGAGAYGVVFEAYDLQEDSLVALKVLHNADADALYRFKKGFRSLSDLRHQNLVAFHELLSEDGFWFFTMELINGVDLIAYLRGGARHRSGVSSVDRFRAGRWDSEPVYPRSDPQPEAVTSGPSEDRVREVLRQLARGLHVLHQSGKLHRDIKPPNVLITAHDHRLVLLDFGLVAELEGGLQSVVAPFLGTPAYMSPEQAAGATCTPASDWYSVGVMIYEALLGELPFDVSLAEMTALKERGEWFRQGLADAGIADDLRRLTEGLLQPRAADRLSAEEIFSLLETTPTAPTIIAPHRIHSRVFVGREEPMAALAEALASSRRAAVAFYIRGASGMGKSALAHRFLDQLEADGEDAVVLMGRCFQQESVPYKAFDSLIDALTRYLRSLDDHQVEVLLPVRIAALARLFPVLRRVPAIAEIRDSAAEEGDPQQLRRRAAAALRRLLARIAEHRTLILFIDDLQWGDEDSFSLLEQLLRPPDPPAFLLIGCYRSEDEVSSPFLRQLAEHRVALGTRGVDVRDLELAELEDRESRQLVELAVEREGIELDRQQIEKIVREAGGSPFLLSELVRGGSKLPTTAGEPTTVAGARLPAWATGEFQLSDLILSRVADLPAAARRLLELVAVAGKPVEVEAAAQAARLKLPPEETGAGTGRAAERTAADGATRGSILALLQRSKLIRLLVTEDRQEIEICHDRIREALVESLSEDRLRTLHRQLAETLESTGRAEPETLALHFRATADEERARAYATTAAARAEEALAFDHAARLYRMALDLLPAEPEEDNPEHYQLRVRLGDAQANAGLSREAAETFLRAASDSGSINPFDAQRNAAENLLISGQIERGLTVLGHLLDDVDLKFESRPSRMKLELWWRRLLLRLRRYRFKPRPEAECSLQELRRIDLCWSAETGLCLVDIFQASLFHARHLQLALAAGETMRVARGMAMEVFFSAVEGRDVAAALERARDLAGRAEGIYAASLTETAAAMGSCSTGAWEEAWRRLERAERYLRETGTGVAWELDTVRHFQILALFYLGRWSELFEQLPGWLEEARRRGDLYLEVQLCNWAVSLRHLCADRPQQAFDVAREASQRWSQKAFHYQHFGQMMAEAQVALYSGRGRAAWRLVNRRWEGLNRSMLQRIEMVEVQSLDLRVRCALAAAVDPRTREPGRRRLLAQARQDTRRIERIGSGWAHGLAATLRAGLAMAEGPRGRERAIDHLRGAEKAFEASHMSVHAQVTRYRRGQLEGDDAGRRTHAEAREELRRREVERPDRLCDMLVPGWTRPSS